MKMESNYHGSSSENPGSPLPTSAGQPNLELHDRIADLRNLIASINDALRDLARTNLPPLNHDFDFYSEVRRFESELINDALRLTGGSQVKAARLLQLKTTTLNAKMKTLNLRPSQTQVP
jgi:DNA-binding NtrC family response regulator